MKQKVVEAEAREGGLSLAQRWKIARGVIKAKQFIVIQSPEGVEEMSTFDKALYVVLSDFYDEVDPNHMLDVIGAIHAEIWDLIPQKRTGVNLDINWNACVDEMRRRLEGEND